MTDIEQIATARVVSPEAQHIGTLLDEHHGPETNGRMAICRRCGTRTDGPQGHHSPDERELIRADSWLKQQDVEARVARMKMERGR